MDELLERAKKIKCVICDVDGVLTNGVLYLDNVCNEIKAFHVHDGTGLKLLMGAGIEVAVITTSITEVVEHRLKQLGIKHHFLGQLNKQHAYEGLKERLNLEDESFAYIGDDFPDLPIMQQVGLGIAVANATPLVKDAVKWHTKLKGGEGAVREVCDLIITAQDKWDEAMKGYFRL